MGRKEQLRYHLAAREARGASYGPGAWRAQMASAELFFDPVLLFFAHVHNANMPDDQESTDFKYHCKIRIEGDYIYAELIVPPAMQATAAFMRAELKKNADKWVWKMKSNLPYPTNRFTAIIGDSEMAKSADHQAHSIPDNRCNHRALGACCRCAKLHGWLSQQPG
jgi:hypothetical protein